MFDPMTVNSNQLTLQLRWRNTFEGALVAEGCPHRASCYGYVWIEVGHSAVYWLAHDRRALPSTTNVLKLLQKRKYVFVYNDHIFKTRFIRGIKMFLES